MKQQIYNPKLNEELTYHIESISGAKTELIRNTRTVKMKCVFEGEGMRYFQIKLIRSNCQNSSSSTVLRKMNMAFSYIMLEVTTNGEIMRVTNTKQIKEHWSKTKNDLSKDCAGEAFESLFRDIDKTMSDEQKFAKSMQHPKLYGLLFNNCWIYDDEQPEQNIEITKQDDESALLNIEPESPLQEKGSFLYDTKALKEGYIIRNDVRYDIIRIA
ncbi:MAG: hypothetical protein ACK5L5_09900 [Bacteroidales bacterium]